MLGSVPDVIDDALDILAHAIKVFVRYPKLLAPLLTTWVIYASLILYLRFGVNWEALELSIAVMIGFGAILILSASLSISCLILLEMIQHIETGGHPKLIRATWVTLVSNLPRALPIIFVWAILWFILMILSAIFSRRDREDRDSELNAENAARALSGEGTAWFSLSSLVKLLNKALRMVVFLILPPIAWLDSGPIDATKRGLAALRQHLGEFTAGFVLSQGVAILVGLPVAAFFYFVDEADWNPPEIAWYGIIFYGAFTWSFVIYIEQMFAAELFLWHLKWCRASVEAAKRNHAAPRLRRVERPCLLDDEAELLGYEKPEKQTESRDSSQL